MKRAYKSKWSSIRREGSILDNQKSRYILGYKRQIDSLITHLLKYIYYVQNVRSTPRISCNCEMVLENYYIDALSDIYLCDFLGSGKRESSVRDLKEVGWISHRTFFRCENTRSFHLFDSHREISEYRKGSYSQERARTA